jgi:hypothetical protein
VGGLRLERARDPVAAAHECVPRKLEQPTPPQAAQCPATERETGSRPELGREKPEGQVGIVHEVVELGLPGGTVGGGVATELLHVALERTRDECRGAVGERGPGRQVGVDVRDPAAIELVLELRVCGRAGEERMPRGEHLMGEPRKRELVGRPDAAAGNVVALEDAHAPAVAGEEGGADQ